MDVDRCVVCGEPVPEGRMVCWQCHRRGRPCETCAYFDPVYGICYGTEGKYRPYLMTANDICPVRKENTL